MTSVAWLEPLAAALALDGEAVLVIVAATQGSAPREPGAAMVIARAAVHGTIGGGHLEFEALRIGRDALAAAATPGGWIVRFPLAARLAGGQGRRHRSPRVSVGFGPCAGRTRSAAA